MGKSTLGFYLTLTFVFNRYLQTISKLLIHDPRPYMVDERVEAMSCSHEYGNPSGHAYIFGHQARNMGCSILPYLLQRLNL
ncbi:UNKNOWN [Stylonychia lemnae]|uniref:Uncharacterized protein n=1 Tax=Stylonychia lemnae TaxID=5949 RepID=A0A078AXK2_STYLE|nr:UNKNOWN [Stylonychia lemnae]|eukprot:CDW85967.1 UNKNOWN [Stylonychia lemnae]